LAGIDQERFNAGMRMFVRHLGDVNRQSGGFKQIAETFHKLGIKATGRDPADVLMDLSKAFQAMPAAADRASLAMQLFSRYGGARFGSWLAQGPDAIMKNADALHALGSFLTEGDLKKSEKFHAGMIAFEESMKGLKQIIGLAVMPAITEMIDKFIVWYELNGKIIRQGLEQTVHAIADVLGMLGRILGFLLDKLTIGVKWIGGWERGFRLLGSAVLALLAMKVATAIWGIVDSIYAAATATGTWAAAFAATGWGALLIGLTLAIEDVISYFQGKKSITGLIVNKFNEIRPAIEKFFRDIGTWIHKWVIDPLNEAIAILDRFAGHPARVPYSPQGFNQPTSDKTSFDGIFDFVRSMMAPKMIPVTTSVPATAMAGPGSRPSAGNWQSVKLDVHMPTTINVPVGTTEKQAREIQLQVMAATEKQLDKVIRNAFTDHPEYGGH
jgi:hypothetical protein